MIHAPGTGPPVVITVAPTGMVPRRRDGIAVPEQPDQIAADVQRAVVAGASCAHLHARDEDGEPTYRRERYAEIIRAVRRVAPDIVISVSTSGRVHNTFEQRSHVLDLDGDLKPDLASLTLGSMNFPTQASVNSPEMIHRLACAMCERGIVPELEIFDFGMIDYAHYLIRRRILEPPFVCNLLLGSLGTSAATPLNLALPPAPRAGASVNGGCQFDSCGGRKSDSRQHGLAAGREPRPRPVILNRRNPDARATHSASSKLASRFGAAPGRPRRDRISIRVELLSASQSVLPSAASSTWRTFRARRSGANGFCRNAAPPCRSPCRTIVSSVYPDM